MHSPAAGADCPISQLVAYVMFLAQSQDRSFYLMACRAPQRGGRQLALQFYVEMRC